MSITKRKAHNYDISETDLAGELVEPNGLSQNGYGRGGGGGLAGGRLRVAVLANLGLSVESRVVLVVGLPWSSYTVVGKLFAKCVTLASCASECWDRAAALVSTASALLSIL